DPGDLNAASEDQGAFTYAQQPERLAVGYLTLFDASAVVGDFQDNVTLMLLHAYSHQRGAGMAGDVGQDLLKDAKHGGRFLRAQRHVFGERRDLALDLRAPLKLSGLPFDGGGKAEIIQH